MPNRVSHQAITTSTSGIQEPQHGEQRRFAAPRRSGNRDVLTFLYFQMNFRERVGLHLVRLKDLFHSIELDQRVICLRHVVSSSYEPMEITCKISPQPDDSVAALLLLEPNPIAIITRPPPRKNHFLA